MSYVHTGRMSKYLNSPKPSFSDYLLTIQDEIDNLHEQYDNMRCGDCRTWMPAPLSNEAREIGKKLAAMQNLYNAIFESENPEYVKHWRY